MQAENQRLRAAACMLLASMTDPVVFAHGLQPSGPILYDSIASQRADSLAYSSSGPKIAQVSAPALLIKGKLMLHDDYCLYGSMLFRICRMYAAPIHFKSS